MADLKYKIDQDEVSVELDLESIFGDSVKSSTTRRLIGEALIEKIISRAESGKGVNTSSGREVKLKSPYSKEYADSLEFKAYGKKKDDVNMKLTGSMLASIDVINDNSKKIKIGIGNEDAPKAYNHQTGDTVPKRPFFGVTKGDIKEILSEFADQVDIKPTTAADIFEEQAFKTLFKELSKRGVI